MSARRSCRMRNLRKGCSQPEVRSTTQRQRPSLSRDSTPSRANRTAMPRLRNQARWAFEAYARSACNLPGRLRTERAGPFTAGIDATKRMRKRASCPCAPEIRATSGSPRSSTSKWCLLPGSPRSVGLRPACSPPAGASTLAASTQARSHMLWSCSRRRRRIAFVDALPNADTHPFVKATPACHATAAAEFAQQVLPGYCGQEDKQHSRHSRAIINAWPPPL